MICNVLPSLVLKLSKSRMFGFLSPIRYTSIIVNEKHVQIYLLLLIARQLASLLKLVHTKARMHGLEKNAKIRTHFKKAFS